MSEQNGKQAEVVKRPTNEDKWEWIDYWEQQGQKWREEPEISVERQIYLAKLCRTPQDYMLDIYPFEGVVLTRADVEWLLAIYEDDRGEANSGDVSRVLGSKPEMLILRGADLRHVNLRDLPLSGVDLRGARLENAILNEAHLEGALLSRAHMEGADLLGAHLEGADLFNAFFDSVTTLNGAYFSNKQWGAATLVDVHWADVNLAVVDWSTVSVLGDEIMARSIKTTVGVFRRHGDPGLYERPARTYRQLAVVLRNQGLSDEANRFAYRAQLMQHKVYWYQKKLPQWLFSWFLSLLAGYGYKPLRSFLAYLIVIATFAAAYFIVGQRVGPALSPLSAWVFSMTSFHGRGFFPGGIKLDDPFTVLAAFEAFIGLLIEVTFIATFTRRLFGQ